jgi:hypothetical protein
VLALDGDADAWKRWAAHHDVGRLLQAARCMGDLKEMRTSTEADCDESQGRKLASELTCLS